MGDSLIQICPSVKFLGLIYDQHLNWKDHIHYIKGRCTRALCLLRKLSHTTWGATRSTLVMLYKALVLSILDYGCPIYGSATDPVLRLLDPIHNQGIRLCTGAFRSSPIPSLFADCGEPPLSYHRALVTMRCALRVKFSDSPASSLFQDVDASISQPQHSSFPLRATLLLNATGFNVAVPPVIADPVPWSLSSPRVCTRLSFLSKGYNFVPTHHRQHTLEHIRRKGPHFAIYTDGSKSSSGVGIAAVSPTQSLQYSLPCQASVFTAELLAIHSAIDLITRSPPQIYVIYSDSRSALEALQTYSSPNPIVVSIQRSLHDLRLRRIQVSLCWVPAHVGVAGNENADVAAKAAVTMTQLQPQLPLGDWVSSLKPYVMGLWQSEWSAQPRTNKLRTLKPSVNLWPSSLWPHRHLEVLLTRLRIGHTRLTHGYLMSSPHGQAPVCPSCTTPLTIRHIFMDCPATLPHRISCFGNKTFDTIISDSPSFSMSSILRFLRRLNVLTEI